MGRPRDTDFGTEVTAEERALVERLADTFRNAFLGRPVRWHAVDGPDGRRLLAFDADRPGECLGRFRPADLSDGADPDELFLRIITGAE